MYAGFCLSPHLTDAHHLFRTFQLYVHPDKHPFVQEPVSSVETFAFVGGPSLHLPGFLAFNASLRLFTRCSFSVLADCLDHGSSLWGIGLSLKGILVLPVNNLFNDTTVCNLPSCHCLLQDGFLINVPTKNTFCQNV